jgi:hypothetical protein
MPRQRAWHRHSSRLPQALGAMISQLLAEVVADGCSFAAEDKESVMEAHIPDFSWEEWRRMSPRSGNSRASSRALTAPGSLPTSAWAGASRPFHHRPSRACILDRPCVVRSLFRRGAKCQSADAPVKSFGPRPGEGSSLGASWLVSRNCSALCLRGQICPPAAEIGDLPGPGDGMRLAEKA